MALAGSGVVLAEGAVVERLRRNPDCRLNEHVAHAGFVYEATAARILEELYREYLDVARAARLPMLVFSPTWRANPERLRRAGLGLEANHDAVAFVRRIAAEYETVEVGGLMGCRGDAYRPEEALDEREAAEFHAQQARALADAGCNFLCAATMPAASEALGMAAAMARTGVRYLISFIVTAQAALLDGTPVGETMARIDGEVRPAPFGYMVNCVHPRVLASAFGRCDSASRGRILGLQANTSTRSPAELEGSEYLESEDPEPFADSMMDLQRRFQLRILGGCCGTDARHIAAIARRLRAA